MTLTVDSDMRFAWDPRKARGNFTKHGVTFEEAATSFADELGLELSDQDHPDRLILIGMSSSTRLLLVVHAVLESDDVVRIISARLTTRNERRKYEEGSF